MVNAVMVLPKEGLFGGGNVIMTTPFNCGESSSDSINLSFSL